MHEMVGVCICLYAVAGECKCWVLAAVSPHEEMAALDSGQDLNYFWICAAVKTFTLDVMNKYKQLAHFVDSCAVPCVGWILIILHSCANSACVLCLASGNSKVFFCLLFLSIVVALPFGEGS